MPKARTKSLRMTAANDEALVLAGGDNESLSKDPQNRIEAEGHHCWHVKGFANASVSGLAHSSASINGSSGPPFSRR